VSRFQSSHDFAAGTLANFGIEATLENPESSVAYGFEGPKRARHRNEWNFKSATLGLIRLDVKRPVFARTGFFYLRGVGSLAVHGMMGTVEMAFLGEPSPLAPGFTRGA